MKLIPSMPKRQKKLATYAKITLPPIKEAVFSLVKKLFFILAPNNAYPMPKKRIYTLYVLNVFK